jgi:hypothetical protein
MLTAYWIIQENWTGTGNIPEFIQIRGKENSCLMVVMGLVINV